LAKIAVELEQAVARRAVTGIPGHPAARVLARGDGWEVSDVVCTSGPRDRPFEEQHSRFSIAIVTAGSFEYRSGNGRELMTPGSLLLGNVDQSFECGHEYGVGDRCLSFHYEPDYFENLAADAGGVKPDFRVLRVPPLRALSPLVTRACAGLARFSIAGRVDVAWEEVSIQLAAQTVQLAGSLSRKSIGSTPGAVARVTRAVRLIERRPDAALALGSLAQEARLSPYHFLRTFEGVTGLTPHQYVLRARLRAAAMRLADTWSAPPAKILDIALDAGFGDVSNFNRAFRAEFGVSPRVYRRQHL
jgi:AraC family transcriptional regulator